MLPSAIIAWLRKNFWGLATLIGAIVVCAIIVQTFKKPGQMSVIESQAMDMSAMVPPPGAVPVGIAKVERQVVNSSVTYTGTVQAFTDEDIYSRVTGRIVAMPVYAGDRIQKGQLLVQLDPAHDSEYAAKREEAASAEDAAMHNAGIAKSEFMQKKYELEAAQEAEHAAKKAIEEAEANLSYWKPEVERQSALLKAQVVSLDEYQKEAAELRAAEAKVEQARAKQREATKTKLASQAAFEAMIHHIGHQSSAARQAKAALKNASIYEKYTRIVAQEDGVVTKRVISPGVVVNPGMLLLKVARVKQVRVQAEVASEDAENIHLGNKVYVKSSESSANEVKAAVTSIFPAADPVSRTFTVEALINNLASHPGSQSTKVGTVRQYRFLPGQYVIMQILTGQQEGLTIPTSAVVRREGKAQVWKAVEGNVHNGSVARKYTCVMHPEVVSDKPGKCPKCSMDLVPKVVGGKTVAQLVNIEIGLSNPDRTEVKQGLREGDKVIFAGWANLHPGMPVVGTEWGKSGPTKLPLASELASKRLDSSNNFTYEEMIGALMIKVSLSPAQGGSNTIIVRVNKHEGGVVPGARVLVKSSMPSMKMAGPQLNGSTGNNGEAIMKSNLMSGLWQLNVSIAAQGEEPAEIVLDAEVP